MFVARPALAHKAPLFHLLLSLFFAFLCPFSRRSCATPSNVRATAACANRVCGTRRGASPKGRHETPVRNAASKTKGRATHVLGCSHSLTLLALPAVPQESAQRERPRLCCALLPPARLLLGAQSEERKRRRDVAPEGSGGIRCDAASSSTDERARERENEKASGRESERARGEDSGIFGSGEERVLEDKPNVTAFTPNNPHLPPVSLPTPLFFLIPFGSTARALCGALASRATNA